MSIQVHDIIIGFSFTKILYTHKNNVQFYVKKGIQKDQISYRDSYIYEINKVSTYQSIQ